MSRIFSGMEQYINILFFLFTIFRGIGTVLRGLDKGKSLS